MELGFGQAPIGGKVAQGESLSPRFHGVRVQKQSLKSLQLQKDPGADLGLRGVGGQLLQKLDLLANTRGEMYRKEGLLPSGRAALGRARRRAECERAQHLSSGEPH